MKGYCAIVVSLVLLSWGASGAVWHVDWENDSGVEDGTSWATAFTAIQPAIDAAAADGGGEVWVAEGVYTSTSAVVATLTTGVSVYGGFSGVEASREERNWTARVTTVDGEDSRCCVRGASDAVFDGFTVTRGSSGGGGGMYNYGVEPTVRNCRFVSNTASSWGGGMFNNYASPTLIGCVFESNYAPDGGGICNVQTSSPTMRNCVFRNNTANWGAAVCVAHAETSPVMEHCTFTENGAESGGGVISVNLGATPTFTNCILWGNMPDEVFNFSGNAATVAHSDVEGGYAGEGNIDADPLFLSATDLRLGPGSPCIDAGTTIEWIETDLDGVARPQGAGYDMGAYEYAGTTEPDWAGRVMVRLAKIDDKGTVYLNEAMVLETNWGDGEGGVYTGHHPGFSDLTDVTDLLNPGLNTFRFVVWNDAACCGVSGFLEIIVDGTTVYRDGISMQDSTEGVKFDDTFLLDWANEDATGRLYGRIEDAATYEAIRCATVTASASGGSAFVGAVDVNGEYHIGGLPFGTYTLNVYAPGYARIGGMEIALDDETVEQDFVLTPLAAATTISGVATDFDSAALLGGVRVDASVADVHVATTYTCREGRYEIEAPSAKTTQVELLFTAPMYDEQTVDVDLSPGVPASVDVQLTAKAVIPTVVTGAVEEEATNAAVADAQVTASQASVAWTVYTDHEGLYAIAGLLGRCNMEASAAGYENQSRDVSIEESEPTKCEDFALGRASAEGEGEGEGPAPSCAANVTTGGSTAGGSGMVAGLLSLALMVAARLRGRRHLSEEP